eukprot:CAMPEP_0177536620 /NCGR_PEP_ID=MMETSP0369-20130122/57279_1 /TAXON_ID=447022 ORGANISM="Scrippsiella hangoei-like, Strain SHHI-4" /NCGR_SAMPLE_ID=MMETSP0369 /ASSEMBLY_ACC=CAM_ASM_000364 /LENGTH=156 /DNA_ID=CAMNT_0019019053 /DNA_START=63 /DNA_END=530 /DNA_ORIENTATION=-
MAYNSRVLYELAETTHTAIFRQQAMQALIDFTWRSLVCRHYTAHMCIRLLELMVLLGCVCRPPDSDLQQRLSWSFVAATCLREILRSIERMLGYRTLTGTWMSYFEYSWNVFELGSILVCAFMVGNSAESLLLVQDRFAHPEVLSAVCFYRWIGLL